MQPLFELSRDLLGTSKPPVARDLPPKILRETFVSNACRVRVYLFCRFNNEMRVQEGNREVERE